MIRLTEWASKETFWMFNLARCASGDKEVSSGKRWISEDMYEKKKRHIKLSAEKLQRGLRRGTARYIHNWRFQSIVIWYPICLVQGYSEWHLTIWLPRNWFTTKFKAQQCVRIAGWVVGNDNEIITTSYKVIGHSVLNYATPICSP